MNDIESLFKHLIKMCFQASDFKHVVFNRLPAGKIFQDIYQDVRVFLQLNLITVIPSRDPDLGLTYARIIYPEADKNKMYVEFYDKMYIFNGSFAWNGRYNITYDKNFTEIKLNSKKAIINAINSLDFQEITR